MWTYAFFDAQVADFNHDGKRDLALWSTIAYKVLLNGGNARFEDIENMPLIRPPAAPFGFHGTVADVDGDGFDDLLVADNEGGWHLMVNRSGHFAEVPVTLSSERTRAGGEGLMGADSFKAFSAVVPARLGDGGGLALLALEADGQVAVFERKKRPALSSR